MVQLSCLGSFDCRGGSAAASLVLTIWFIVPVLMIANNLSFAAMGESAFDSAPLLGRVLDLPFSTYNTDFPNKPADLLNFIWCADNWLTDVGSSVFTGLD